MCVGLKVRPRASTRSSRDFKDSTKHPVTHSPHEPPIQQVSLNDSKVKSRNPHPPGSFFLHISLLNTSSTFLAAGLTTDPQSITCLACKDEGCRPQLAQLGRGFSGCSSHATVGIISRPPHRYNGVSDDRVPQAVLMGALESHPGQ